MPNPFESTERNSSNGVAFFFGAGASKEAGVPDTVGLKDKFFAQIPRTSPDTRNSNIWDFLDKLGKWAEVQDPPRTVDVELVLETLQRLTNWGQDPVLGLLGLAVKQFDQTGFEPAGLLRSLQDFIKERVVVDASNIAYLEPLRGFIDVFRPLNIFSVNYDTAIEVFCAEHKLKYRDGFDEAWNPKVFDDPDLDVRLFKLHGSVTWYRSDRGRFLKIPALFKDSSVELITKERAELLMLYPAQKFGYVEPLFELMLQMKQRLGDCGTLVVVGYSFRDEHIRRIFWDIARERPGFHMVLIDPDAGNIYRKRLRTYEDGTILSPLAARVTCLPFLFGEMFPTLQSDVLRDLWQSRAQANAQFAQERKGLATATDWQSCILTTARGGDHELLRRILERRERLQHVDHLLLLKSIMWGLFYAAGNQDQQNATYFWSRFREMVLDLIDDLAITINVQASILYNPLTRTPNSTALVNIITQLAEQSIKSHAQLQWIQGVGATRSQTVVNALDAILSTLNIWAKGNVSFAEYLSARKGVCSEQLRSTLCALQGDSSTTLDIREQQPTVEEGVKQAEKTVVLATLEKFDSKFDFPPPIPTNS